MTTAVAEILTVSEEDYHADKFAPTPSLSSSLCKILCDSTPWHAWTEHPRLNPNFVREEKETFDLGTVTHALMLQGLSVGHIIKATKWEGRGKNRVDTGEPVQDYKTKEAREERTAARAAGRVPILTNQWQRVEAMVLAGKSQLAAHREASDAFVDGKPEQTLTWMDDHGVFCRARLDWLKSDFTRIYDYKSTGVSANPEALGRFIVSQGWDIQAAWYTRGLKAITGKEPDFFFVPQEDYAPHALSVVGLSEEFKILGAKKVQWAIDLWAKCLESGKWPGYTNRIYDPPMPSWEAERWALKESA